jgi:cell division protein FtsX
MSLQDAQAVLNKPGQINQIMALGCHCAGATLPGIRKQLTEVLPETRITEFRSMALARAEQRDLVAGKQQDLLAQMQRNLRDREQLLAERRKALAQIAASRMRIQQMIGTLADVVTPLVVLATAIWVGLLALANVRERRAEIGLLRALGKSSAMIGALFLGKALLLGLLGAALGLGLGVATVRWFGLHAMQLAPGQLAVQAEIVLAALGGAPLVAILASYLPTLSALLQDPAVVLREP